VSLGQNSWPIVFVPPLTQTAVVPPGASITLTAVATIPPDVYAGELDTAVFTATSQNYPGTSDTANVTTNALLNVAVAWDVASQNGAAAPGLIVSYYIIVRNEGNQDDVFTLQPIGANWPTAVYEDTFAQMITQTAVLAPNETFRVGVRVQVSADASVPEQDGLVLRAVSSLVDTVSDYTMVVTAVAGASTGVELNPAGDWQLTLPGTAVAYTLVVSNTGSTAATYAVSVLDALWTTNAPSSIGPIAPGTAMLLPLTVTVPITAPSGAWDEVVVQVSEVGNTAVSDQAALFTLLPGDPILPPPPPAPPNLAASTMQASPDTVQAGERISYTIVLRNSGELTAQTMLTDVLPAETTFVAGSLVASAGTAVANGNTIQWQGDVASSPITITSQVTVSSGVMTGTVVANTAVFSHDQLMYEVRAETAVINKTVSDNTIYLPLIRH
jgi:uncharacterized repeat protein (TIGR01451 family)